MPGDERNQLHAVHRELCASSDRVQAQPAMLAAVRNRLDAIAEAEVLGESEEGKLVVVLDTANSREAD